jgi:hypothetical protein
MKETPFLGRDLFLHQRVYTDSGVHRASCQIGSRTYNPGVMRQGREAEHISPTSAEVKNGGAILLLPHASLCHTAKIIKHGDNFTFM